MKNKISIFFLATYLLATTQLSEILKLPMLVQHFIEHKKENNNISFFDFLDMHYAHGSPKDADYDEDMKLPFKSIVNSGLATLTFCSPIPFFKLIPKIYFKETKKQFSTYSFTYSNLFFSAIWQPPKSCLSHINRFKF